MNIRIDNESERTLISLKGSIDIPGAKSLQKTFDKILNETPKEVDIDLELVVALDGVDAIGSSGIGALLLFHKECSLRGIKCRIINPNKEIRALFSIIKLDKLFKF